MKFVFKGLALATILASHCLMAGPTKHMILFSGTPSKDFKEVLNKSLSHTLPEWKELSKFEENNPKCKRRKKFLIQFCLKGDKLTIVHQNEKALRRTVAKLVKLDDAGELKSEAHILKAFQ